MGFHQQQKTAWNVSFHQPWFGQCYQEQTSKVVWKGPEKVSNHLVYGGNKDFRIRSVDWAKAQCTLGTPYTLRRIHTRLVITKNANSFDNVIHFWKNPFKMVYLGCVIPLNLFWFGHLLIESNITELFLLCCPLERPNFSTNYKIDSFQHALPPLRIRLHKPF